MNEVIRSLCVRVGSGGHRLGLPCASCREIKVVLDGYVAERAKAEAELNQQISLLRAALDLASGEIKRMRDGKGEP